MNGKAERRDKEGRKEAKETHPHSLDVHAFTYLIVRSGIIFNFVNVCLSCPSAHPVTICEKEKKESRKTNNRRDEGVGGRERGLLWKEKQT